MKNNITLKFTLDSSTSKEIKGINIDIRNLSDKYNVQGLTAGDTQIDVTAKGVESVLKGLTSDDITAYINLKDLRPGEHEVDVKVEGADSRVQLIPKTKKDKIKIYEK